MKVSNKQEYLTFFKSYTVTIEIRKKNDDAHGFIFVCMYIFIYVYINCGKHVIMW